MTISKQIEIDVEVHACSSMAVQVFDGKTKCWIPRSQISDFCGDGDEVDATTTSIFVPEWLALEKGLI